MSTTEPGYQDIQGGDLERQPGVPTELWSLLRTISTQIDEADQRHTGLLQDLRDRLASLSREAEEVRDTVPASAAPAYERIESGLAELAQRIDALDEPGLPADAPVSDGPAVLKSAAHVVETPGRAQSNGGIDPFDIVGDDDSENGAWDRTDAEALTRIYEESDAALVRISPRSQEPEDGVEPSAELPDMLPLPAAGDPLNIFAAAPQVVSAQPAGFDREWLDQRLSDIALRLEQSLADFRGDFGADHLGVRFNEFEERMGSVLGDVATRSDVEGLRQLEGQIQDLAAHLEHTERQLGRLDGIEQQLQAVIDHLSADFDAASQGIVADATLPDFKSLAHSTAEEVAQRFAAGLNAAGGDPRIDELGSLLRSMIHDRRQSDEQTFTMLDTVQQAMIRVLDRMDALELASSQTDAGTNASEPAAIQDFGAPEPDEHELPMSVRAGRAAAPETHYMAPPPPVDMPSTHASAPVVAAAAAPTTVDKLRQDFIADAQRAKLRAQSAAAAPDTPGAAVSGASAAARASRAMPRPTVQASGAPDAAAAGSTRRQKLTALALCLVIAASGAALFAKRSTAPAPLAPAGVTEIMPSAAAPAGDTVTEDVTGIDVPAAPQVDGAAPATAEGAGFEVPADAQPDVPAPVPGNDTPSGATGGGGPQMNEDALGFGDEVPSGGEVLENRPDPDRGPQVQGRAPHGIILQNGSRQPTAQELVQLQSQQNFAALSSRLGTSASQLSPADLMPEEVAKHSVSRIAATAQDARTAVAVPASLSVAAMPGQNVELPATVSGKSFSQLSLPPATVGPLSLRLAAANGDPSAAFEVGARLAEGKGTTQNFHEAIIWYQKSASQGFAQAQYRLGTLYERGLGVKPDVARAQMWYQRAAEQGHIKAMHNLAVLSAGRMTGSPDYISAARWFEGASEYGLADSQYNLAVLHENGLGVAKDLAKAFKWYALAGRAGDKEAMRRKDALEAQLSDDQLRAVERELAQFQPKRSEPLINDARAAGEDWKKRQDS